jgi:hypothetical protein
MAGFLRCSVLALLALVAWPASAADDNTVSNVYMTGAEVRLDRATDGDLVAAAGRISIESSVAGDAVLAAGAMDITGAIGDDLRAAGGIVTLSSAVYGEAVIGAGKLTIGPQAEIHRRARLAANDLILGGKLLAGVSAYGRNVQVTAEILGSAELSGEHIEILPSARILGDLTYSSPREIKIHPGARISGKVVRASNVFTFPRPKLRIPGLPALKPLLLLGLLAAGMALLAVFPRFAETSVRTLHAFPLRSLGLGTAILFSVPPVIVLLIITIIGIPIALALAAVYAFTLLAGYLVTALFIGDRLAHAVRKTGLRYGAKVLSLAGALLLLWLVGGIPYAAPLVMLITLVLGIGAMVLQAFTRYTAQP